MSGKYFVEKVKPLNCLTAEEMTEILSYQHVKEGNCGRFNIKPRGNRWRTKFMNGRNILKDWSMGDRMEIEYDSDPEGRIHGNHGSHVHKGTVVNIKENWGYDTYEILIERQNGTYITYPLDDINIKLIDPSLNDNCID